MKSLVVLLAVASLLLNWGCVGTQMAMERDSLLKRGYPAEYADGYGDGYGSGVAAAGNPYAQTTKNVTRYIEDAKYKTGWDDGFAKGKGNYEATGAAVNSLRR
jgi:hypothetical protein